MFSAKFILTGTMPLLMHNDEVEASDMLMAWRKDPANRNLSVAGDDRSPPWTWQTYLYTDGENVVVPSQNLMVCLRSAGTQMILKKQKTFKEISQSGLLIRTEYLSLTVDGKLVPLEPLEAIRNNPFVDHSAAARDAGFRLFVKRAKVGQSKHVRVRPRFDKWQLSGTIDVLASEINWDNLTMLFDLAGRVGLCDWRPGCKTPGPYGMFTAELKKC